MDHPRPLLGMVGAGQLARMCWQAGIGLDVGMRLLAAHADDAAARVVPDPLIGDPDDPAALAELARRCDVVTLDHELVDGATLRDLQAHGHIVRPSPATLRYAQDKAFQRTRFAAAGLPVPAHEVVYDVAAAQRFAADHGWPVVVKLARGGYDGRGVWLVEDAAAMARVWQQVPERDPLLVEEAVAITHEVAVLLARRPSGDQVTAPVIETVQDGGMLRELVVPARLPDDVRVRALTLARSVADLVDVSGICAVELFWDGGELLINEIAVRPHNSGHWTIDAAATSQFENHVRAVLDWPLGDMDATAPAVCSVNVVGTGDAWPQHRIAAALEVPHAHVHLYGKRPRRGRKLGHVTATGGSVDAARAAAHEAAERLTATGADRVPRRPSPSYPSPGGGW